LDSGSTDLWVTSGHATEHGWQIGFRYKNGFFKSKAGQLYGEDTSGGIHNVESPNPKVYLPVGNCLMGHIDGPDAMALAYMKSASVRQMAGYIEPTWYGYQGWGMLDYFLEQPGRFNMNEAWRANNQALVYRLETYFPGSASIDPGKLKNEGQLPAVAAKAKEANLTAEDLQGLLFDRDHVAFYGDPAWDARMAKGKLNWDQTFTTDGDTRTLTVKPLLGAQTYATVNHNGSQRGGRPVIQFFDQRIDPHSVKITAGAEWNPVISDDFILVPLPAADSDKPVEIRFTASLAG
jgi:zinc protease